MHIQLTINHTYFYPGTSGISDKQLLTKELRLPSMKKKRPRVWNNMTVGTEQYFN